MVLVVVVGVEFTPELELLVPPPAGRPVDITVSWVATPKDMPYIAAFGAPRLLGARV
jgi:hypothetical protein